MTSSTNEKVLLFEYLIASSRIHTTYQPIQPCMIIRSNTRIQLSYSAGTPTVIF